AHSGTAVARMCDAVRWRSTAATSSKIRHCSKKRPGAPAIRTETALRMLPTPAIETARGGQVKIRPHLRSILSRPSGDGQEKANCLLDLRTILYRICSPQPTTAAGTASLFDQTQYSFLRMPPGSTNRISYPAETGLRRIEILHSEAAIRHVSTLQGVDDAPIGLHFHRLSEGR